jgi:hypothetical protein
MRHGTADLLSSKIIMGALRAHIQHATADSRNLDWVRRSLTTCGGAEAAQPNPKTSIAVPGVPAVNNVALLGS